MSDTTLRLGVLFRPPRFPVIAFARGSWRRCEPYHGLSTKEPKRLPIRATGCGLKTGNNERSETVAIRSTAHCGP